MKKVIVTRSLKNPEKKKRIPPTIQQKQRLFMQKLKETFWALSKDMKNI